MEVVFTVAVVFIAYSLTVNTRNKREIRRLSAEIDEMKQLINMSFLYGKVKEENSEEGSKEIPKEG